MDTPIAAITENALGQSILDAIPYAAYIVDIRTYIIVADNIAAKRRQGQTNIGKYCYACYAGRTEPCQTCPILLRRNKQPFLKEFVPVFNPKLQLWFKLNASFHEMKEGHTLAVLVVTPTDEQPPTFERVEDFGYTDPCTNVANNRRYEEVGPVFLARCQEMNQNAVVLAFKVEGLQRVNSVQGYAKGDKILRGLVNSIRAVLPENSFLARRRGNDFSILFVCQEDTRVELVTLRNHLEEVMRKICSDDRNGLRLRVGASLFPEHSLSFELLNRKARQAVTMEDNSSCSFVFNTYDDKLMNYLRDKEELLLDMAVAIRRGEMQLVFQPKHEISSARIVGAEALIRWHHPGRGMVAPDIFIPLAEKNLTIPAIDNWVLFEVCRLWQHLVHTGTPEVPISINVSPQRFYQADFIETLMKTLKKHNISPAMLEIELTERTALQDINSAVEIMDILRLQGFRVAIDDFGTGYSALNYLRALPFNTVKLDRSFIIDRGEKTPAILKSLVALIKVYNAEVVCEGVETKEQYELARKVGCDFIQGYYTGRPMSANMLEAILKKQKNG